MKRRHELTDDQWEMIQDLLPGKAGKPQKLKLTPGQRNDVTQAEVLIDDTNAGEVIADKAYDSDQFRQAIRKTGAKPVIPSRKGTRKRRYNKQSYKTRNVVERFFNRIKHFRRVATRYDKTDESFMGFVSLSALFVSIK